MTFPLLLRRLPPPDSASLFPTSSLATAEGAQTIFPPLVNTFFRYYRTMPSLSLFRVGLTKSWAVASLTSQKQSASFSVIFSSSTGPPFLFFFAVHVIQDPHPSRRGPRNDPLFLLAFFGSAQRLLPPSLTSSGVSPFPDGHSHRSVVSPGAIVRRANLFLQYLLSFQANCSPFFSCGTNHETLS